MNMMRLRSSGDAYVYPSIGQQTVVRIVQTTLYQTSSWSLKYGLREGVRTVKDF